MILNKCPNCGSENTQGKRFCGDCGADLKRENVENTLSVSDEEVILEDEFIIEDGTLVRYTGDAAEVIVPEGVKIIGKKAFKGNTSIVSVTLPEGVTWIKEYAFKGCKALKTVCLPNSLRGTEWNIFEDTALADLYYNGDLEDWYGICIDGCFGPENGFNLYFNGKLVTTVTLLDDEEVPPYLFNGVNISRVTIPQSVKTIGEGAFWGCVHLAKVDIPDGVQIIGESAFFGCDELISVHIPESVVEIQEDAFGCEAKLRMVFYAGTEAQWAAVKVGNHDNDYTYPPVKLAICQDGSSDFVH